MHFLIAAFAVALCNLFFGIEARAEIWALRTGVAHRSNTEKTNSGSRVLSHSDQAEISGIMLAPASFLQMATLTFRPSYSLGIIDSASTKRIGALGLAGSAFGARRWNETLTSGLGISVSGWEAKSPESEALVLGLLTWTTSKEWRFNLLGGWSPTGWGSGRAFVTGGFKWMPTDAVNVDFLFPLALSTKFLSATEPNASYIFYLGFKGDPKAGFSNHGQFASGAEFLKIQRQAFALSAHYNQKSEGLEWSLGGGFLVQRKIKIFDKFKSISEKGLSNALFVELNLNHTTNVTSFTDSDVFTTHLEDLAEVL